MAAGINIQYHQVQPPGLYLPTRTEMTAKAIPIINERIALSSESSPVRRRRRLKPKSSHAAVGSAGSLPSKAFDTRLILAPQLRQKLAPSTF
jgi:hypothetical protein